MFRAKTGLERLVLGLSQLDKSTPLFLVAGMAGASSKKACLFAAFLAQ